MTQAECAKNRCYYVDSFTRELVADTDREPTAPPERYYEYRKGVNEGIVTETYIVGYEPVIKLLDFSYSINTPASVVSKARKCHFENHGVASKYATARLHAYTVPPEWYDAEVAQYEERPRNEED